MTPLVGPSAFLAGRIFAACAQIDHHTIANMMIFRERAPSVPLAFLMLFNAAGAATMKYDNYGRRLISRPARAATHDSRRTRTTTRARRRPPRIASPRAVARAS